MKNSVLVPEQFSVPSYTDIAAAYWANWCLLSLQVMHNMALACMTLTARSCAGNLKTARSYYEHSSNHDSSR